MGNYQNNCNKNINPFTRHLSYNRVETAKLEIEPQSLQLQLLKVGSRCHYQSRITGIELTQGWEAKRKKFLQLIQVKSIFQKALNFIADIFDFVFILQARLLISLIFSVIQLVVSFFNHVSRYMWAVFISSMFYIFC